ncbi:3-phosphoshikimate 1-carboxyvinyltransferase [Empedobacter sp. 225-1]|uniref:3-phosphoshikimate 1-carboxyvinyltransferase n=1 Tax=unclassified Empedobacter TaxID=2643773 RepID=UPI002577D46B|nr:MULTISPECIES: 3-phosphoshikimate 1-carboxyvinyltransferase [unclassified Empedobacter]MDM1523163.1 3-phosphoshikimate 1-carboxyvinyltransferase [Empedobacter sp. 225-1]MDM1543109.1 3-phosphoshikimate 1-carboxyvinyltransferase [Empedobacter sp. 189-2]
MIEISALQSSINNQLSITGSKSESNRLLLLNQLFENVLTLENISNSEDSQLMQKALANKTDLIDIHHAGTAMRFLTAYFSIQDERKVTLTGSDRMKQRPIKILVDALNELGAEISYQENEGYPPLSIVGKKLTKETITIPSNISSQYITALCLIGTKLENGLTINLDGKIISVPYIQMTIQLLNKVGIKATFEGNTIQVPFTKRIEAQIVQVESDWSSASYYYSLIALSQNSEVKISTYFKDSLQGDSALQNIYAENFGVISTFDNGILSLKNDANFQPKQKIELNLINTPDIAQTIAATCVGLKVNCILTGLETLKIKETDRLVALKNELEKLGAIIRITDDSLAIEGYQDFSETPTFETYNDHRMAMCMAPLAQKYAIRINNEMVVEKSYPTFWEDWTKLGFEIKSI